MGRWRGCWLHVPPVGMLAARAASRAPAFTGSRKPQRATQRWHADNQAGTRTRPLRTPTPAPTPTRRGALCAHPHRHPLFSLLSTLAFLDATTSISSSGKAPSMHTTHTRTRARAHAHARTCTHTHAHTRTHMHTRAHTCTHPPRSTGWPPWRSWGTRSV
eukprot:363481-Chlamydomonas_euryale.AAC.1